MTDANHIGDLNEMVIGDNDHGDSTPTPSEEPKCSSCGVPWVDHMGIMGTCADNKALREDLKDSLEAHDEMRLEIAQLTKERDEAIEERDNERKIAKKYEDRYFSALVERDEARRLACVSMASGGWERFFKTAPLSYEAISEAQSRGWDCFEEKEETP